MSKRRQARSAKWQFLSRPGPGEGHGYGQVRSSSDAQDIRSLNEQKDGIRAFSSASSGNCCGFIEEPELSASYDDLNYGRKFGKVANRSCWQ